MSGKIYWGPPGSYKTSSAVMDEVARCGREGRVLITNIRGLSEAKCREHLPVVAPGFAIVHLRSDVPAELEQLRRWWHWAPVGAYLIFDEIQVVYPLSWSTKDLRALDCEGGREVNGNFLPASVDLIFDMHRHGNWDWLFTTPSIRKVRPEIRAAAECAYKHKNLAILGLPGTRGRFLQAMHLAEDNGNPADVYASQVRRIKPWVFECYDSTATGAVSDTRSGLSALANVRVLLLIGVIVLCVGWAMHAPRPKVVGGEVAASGPIPSEVPLASRRVRGGSALSAASAVGLTGAAWRVVGWVVAEGRPDASFAILWAKGRTRRVAIRDCKRHLFEGWSCEVDGAQATEFSGDDPAEVEQRKGPVAVAAVGADS